MRIGGALSLKAASVWLPDGRESVTTAIGNGLEAEHGERLGVTELPVSDLAGPQMAVLAARAALTAADWDPADVGYLAHGWLYYQGHDFWSPAHYVASELAAHNALPFGVQQMSNAGAMALQLAATAMIAQPELVSALATTADRFCLPGFDRWAGDYDVAYGDAGTAALVGRGDGLRLLSMASIAMPELEVMFRSGDDFAPAPLAHSRPLNVRRPKKKFLEGGGMQGLASTGPAKVREVLELALRDAELSPADERIRCIALPRLGAATINMMYLPVIEDLLKAEPLHLGLRTGHLGAGDFLANLADIVELGVLGPGEIGMVIGGGGGFTLSCVIVQA